MTWVFEMDSSILPICSAYGEPNLATRQHKLNKWWHDSAVGEVTFGGLVASGSLSLLLTSSSPSLPIVVRRHYITSWAHLVLSSTLVSQAYLSIQISRRSAEQNGA